MENLCRELSASDTTDALQVTTCLCRLAREIYVLQLTECRRPFTLFAKDFLSLTSENPFEDYPRRCIYRYAYSILSDMLVHHQSLCRSLFSKTELLPENIESIIQRMDYQGKSPTPTRKSSARVIVPGSFMISFPVSSCGLIAQFANEAAFFMRRVTAEDMKKFFVECVAPEDLRLKYPGRFAMFMENLHNSNLICKEWRYVIEEHRLLRTRDGKSVVTHLYINNVLSRYSVRKSTAETSQMLDAIKSIIDTL